MPLIELKNDPFQWNDIKDAADILWRSTLFSSLSDLTSFFRSHYQNLDLRTWELYSGINVTRRGIVIGNGERIIVGMFGSAPDEIIKNVWIDAKGPGWWELPYPVYENRNMIHSYFGDMWHGMRQATYDALDRAVADCIERGIPPKQIILTGFSMGGGVSMYVFC